MEAIVCALLEPLVDSRAFPDKAPEGVARPYATYQQVGGDPLQFLDPTLPSKKNARVRVNFWAETRLEASAKGRAAEDAFLLANHTKLTGMTALHDDDTDLYGTTQDFSVWF
jgi:hypothetical protein